MTTREAQEAMDGSPALVVRTLWGLNLSGTDRRLAEEDHEDHVAKTEVIRIKFQVGPVKEAQGNGCAIEDVLDVLVARLEGFQQGPFECVENAEAITFLKWAKRSLTDRTAARRAQGVEGTPAAHRSETP